MPVTHTHAHTHTHTHTHLRCRVTAAHGFVGGVSGVNAAGLVASSFQELADFNGQRTLVAKDAAKPKTKISYRQLRYISGGEQATSEGLGTCSTKSRTLYGLVFRKSCMAFCIFFIACECECTMAGNMRCDLVCRSDAQEHQPSCYCLHANLRDLPDLWVVVTLSFWSSRFPRRCASFCIGKDKISAGAPLGICAMTAIFLCSLLLLLALFLVHPKQKCL